jgi:hypothetical protein
VFGRLRTALGLELRRLAPKSGDLMGRRLATNHSRQPTAATEPQKPMQDTTATVISNKTGPARSTVGSMVVVLRVACPQA